jgi:hypothetical protein
MATRRTTKSQTKRSRKTEADSVLEHARTNGNTGDSAANGAAATFGQIRLRAYEIFMERGGAHGDEMNDWLTAEKELSGGTRPRNE